MQSNVLFMELYLFYRLYTMEDISEKQNYLYREVIEAGYNPEAFQEFIVAQNPQKGMNLALYSMNQLKSVTTKFKNIQNTKNQQQEAKVEPKVQTTEQIESPSKKPQEALSSSKQQDYYKKVECYKTKTPPLNEAAVIVIDNFQKREGGIFQSSFIVYQVKVEALKSCVMRRYSDFQWLRQIFQILYPGIPIPPIAKKGKLKRKDDKHLIKRMYILQKFLNRLITIPEIRCSDILYKFLTSKDIKDLENEKSKMKKLKNIPIQKLENIAGQVELKIETNISSFLGKTQKFLTSTQPQVKRIYKDFKGAATMLEGCSEYFNSLAINCRNLNKNLINYRKQVELPQKKNSLFNCLSEMASRYGQLMSQQAKIFRKQMYSMVKYQSFCMLNIIETLDKLNQMQQTYIDHKLALYKKKQKLYDEGNISKWGANQKINSKPEREQAYSIMLPKQTKQILKQRDVYALYNYQAYKQIQRAMRSNDDLLQNYFEQILKLQSSIASRSIMIWADLNIAVKDINIPIAS